MAASAIYSLWSADCLSGIRFFHTLAGLAPAARVQVLLWVKWPVPGLMTFAVCTDASVCCCGCWKHALVGRFWRGVSPPDVACERDCCTREAVQYMQLWSFLLDTHRLRKRWSIQTTGIVAVRCVTWPNLQVDRKACLVFEWLNYSLSCIRHQ